MARPVSAAGDRDVFFAVPIRDNPSQPAQCVRSTDMLTDSIDLSTGNHG